MARHSSRLPRLFQWQYIRWGLAFPTFALALWACNSHDLQVPKPNPQQETDFEILVSPERSVDILFVIDNSPSMDPKQQALAKNFPRMIEALQKLDGGLPDVHVGVVSSDMGAGGGEAKGNCEVVLGNQGILWGNDPDQDPGNARNKFATIKDIQNGCGMNSGTRWISDILNPDGLTRTKNYQGNLNEVFSCLAKAVGVNGCGYEHPLQSLRVALNPQKDVNFDQNKDFLRRRAYLAVVIIADEDDCSANPNNDTNDEMFSWRTLGDTASLRCATRGHVCNNQDIPNYDPYVAGYTDKAPFVTALANCEAKDDTGDPRDYKKLPLIRIRDMIDSVNGVKDRPSDQILVSGIIGWPDEGKLDGVEYRIDKDTTSIPTEQQKLWDYMPICKLPEEKATDGNIYKAYAGLRLKKFIDGFANNGQIFSICKIDNFPQAMKQIGDAIVRKLTPGCVTFPLIDAQPNVEEVQPECQVKDKLACDTPGQDDPKTGLPCLSTGFTEKALSQCVTADGNTLPPTYTKEQFEDGILDDDDHRPCWYLIYDKDPNAGCPNAFKNQRITTLRKGNGNAPAGTLLGMQCLTCATPPVDGESSCPAKGTM